MSRERTQSPRPDRDADMEIDPQSPLDKSDAKVVIITNLTRNVVEAHLKVIFGFYGDITKVDLPVFGKSGQNRGKAALEFADSSSARKAASHMDGGQLDGNVLKSVLLQEGSEMDATDQEASLAPAPVLVPVLVRLPHTAGEVQRGTHLVKGLEGHSVEGALVVGDLRPAMYTDLDAPAPGPDHPFAVADPVRGLRRPEDVPQATQGVDMGVVGLVREATLSGLVGLAAGHTRALGPVRCRIRVTLVTVEAAVVVERGLSVGTEGVEAEAEAVMTSGIADLVLPCNVLFSPKTVAFNHSLSDFTPSE
ncbi:hypothetical protein CVT26_001695 [Gymnopilus dilepis]|uniref:RRM domain-containing protein n=1 Tax=Gymnopilus dilepis TaxID=231916 RepID=A0A409VRG6_9AGAR|nr:hypothetical protein CVT26_001695 [Gymnopilus dilepis]